MYFSYISSSVFKRTAFAPRKGIVCETIPKNKKHRRVSFTFMTILPYLLVLREYYSHGEPLEANSPWALKACYESYFFSPKLPVRGFLLKRAQKRRWTSPQCQYGWALGGPHEKKEDAQLRNPRGWTNLILWFILQKALFSWKLWGS